jgi:putative tryptophan/tyrosine transport system ATP-binding protein
MPRVAETMLAITGLRHTFHPGTPAEMRALQGIDLALERGAFVIVLGTNGSGKSTLLNAVAGSFIPNHGSIRLGDEDITRWPEHRRATLIGRVFQNPFSGTAPSMTVAENLALAAHRTHQGGLGRALSRQRRREIADQVERLGTGLEDRLDAPIGLLSGGQRQALTLLMATFERPQLLLLDEHTAALDPRGAEQVLQLTQEIVSRLRLTTLMVTHSLPQAVRLGDRVLMMHRGRVVHDWSGIRKRRLRVDDLLATFDEVRGAELMDASAAAMLERNYV